MVFHFCCWEGFWDSVGRGPILDKIWMQIGKPIYPVRVLGRVVFGLCGYLAPLGPGILSSIGVGVWRKAPEAFPDSNTTLDTVSLRANILGSAKN